MTVSLYTFFFFLRSRPMSQHQTITLLSKAGGSIDSIFSTLCCLDPKTALWLNLDSQTESDGGNIKRKHVVDNNRRILLSLVFPPFLQARPPSFPSPSDVMHAMSNMHMLRRHQMPNN